MRRTRRSTTSGSRRCATPSPARSASRCASAAGSRPIPHLGVRLDAFVRPREVAAGRAGGRRDVPRQRRAAREPREGAAEVPVPPPRLDGRRGSWPSWSARLGFALAPGVPDDPPARRLSRPRRRPSPAAGRPLLRRPRRSLRGRLTPTQHARGGRRSPSGTAPAQLRTTTMQNLLVLDVPRRALGRLAREAGGAGLPARRLAVPAGHGRLHGHRVLQARAHRDQGLRAAARGGARARLPGFDRTSKLNVTGCPNCCGQHWIADIGIEGKKLKVDGALVDAYYFCVGGAVGRHAGGGAARRLPRARHARCPPPSSGCCASTSTTAAPGESFREFAAAPHRRGAARASWRAGSSRPSAARRAGRPAAARRRRLRWAYFPVFARPRGPPVRRGRRRRRRRARGSRRCSPPGRRVTVVSPALTRALAALRRRADRHVARDLSRRRSRGRRAGVRGDRRPARHAAVARRGARRAASGSTRPTTPRTATSSCPRSCAAGRSPWPSSTGGASPALPARVREELEARLRRGVRRRWPSSRPGRAASCARAARAASADGLARRALGADAATLCVAAGAARPSAGPGSSRGAGGPCA